MELSQRVTFLFGYHNMLINSPLYIQVNGTRKNRIQYSGPLMPPGVNMEEILKEHERQIQQAVRRARLDKGKGKHAERDQSESLLYAAQNGRS